MKILKTFESFFNYYLYSKVTDTKEVWNYTREDIEDLFVEFNDKYNLPISISFITKNKWGGSTVSVSNDDLENIKKENITPVIEINIFTNTEWCNKFCGEEIDFPIHFVNGEYHEDLAKKMYDGFGKIADELEFMLPQIEKRIPEYKIKYSRRLDIDNTWNVHPSGVEYGRVFFHIFLEKIK